MSIPIVYEDDNILVINKPAGISVHKTGPNDQHITVADLLVEKYPELKNVGEDPLRPGIVHRLDKETSGVMLVARTQAAFEYLKNLFQQRKIKKQYLALVYGTPKESSGTITAPLGKIGTKQTLQIKGKKELVERVAITDYRVIKNLGAYTLVEASPKTGRTHQIRIHLKSIGHPIVADHLYGPKSPADPPGVNRLFLHAQSLELTTPDGKSLHLEVDLPDDLALPLAELEKKSDMM